MSAPFPSVPSASPAQAALAPGPDGVWTLHGHWTLQGLGPLLKAQALPVATTPPLTLDGSALQDIDSAGAWVLQRWLPAGSAAYNRIASWIRTGCPAP